MKGMNEQAVQADFERLPLPDWKPWHDRLEAAYRSGGRKAYWDTRVRLFESIPHSPCLGIEIARAYLFSGENDKAMEALKRSFDEGCADFAAVRAEPIYDPIRDDPRFKEILKGVNLEQ
jgi:hypothetical protein